MYIAISAIEEKLKRTELVKYKKFTLVLEILTIADCFKLLNLKNNINMFCMKLQCDKLNFNDPVFKK